MSVGDLRPTGSDPRVVVVVSPNCHLCEDACTIVGAVCAELAVTWASRELGDLDEARRLKWREFTPVVLIDGEVHDMFRVTPDRLRAALA